MISCAEWTGNGSGGVGNHLVDSTLAFLHFFHIELFFIINNSHAANIQISVYQLRNEFIKITIRMFHSFIQIKTGLAV